MTAIITNSMHGSVADAVYNEILSQNARYYYFLGRTLNLEEDRIEPVASESYEAQTRHDIIALRAIEIGDVSFVVPTNAWLSGTVYSKYSSENAGEQTLFYCFTPVTNSVYLCLDNNNGAPSTSVPSGQTPDISVMPDGYKWKFMYTIPLALREKFLNSGYIPVTNSLKARFFSNGSIDSVTISNMGTGYTQATTKIVINDGDGVGAVLTPVITGGKLVNVIIENPGYGYVNPVVTVESTRTSAADATIFLNLSKGDLGTSQAVVESLAIPGTIDSLNINVAGTGYSSETTITITGDGVGATGEVTVSNGVIVGSNITNPGRGYTWCKITLGNVGTGDGTAKITGNVSPPLGHGRDAIRQLGARRLMFYSSINRELLAGFTINNDFRQFGIIRNPRDFSYSTDLYDGTSSTLYTVVVDISTAQPAQYPIGTILSDAFPITGSTSLYAVESVTAYDEGDKVGYTLRAQNGGEILAGTILHKPGNSNSFTVPAVTANAIVKGSFITSAYTVKGSYNIAAFDADDELFSGTNTYVVIAKNGSDDLLVLPTNGGEIVPGQILTKKNTPNTCTVSVAIIPSFDVNTGDLLYIDNRAAFSQTEDQSVTFRTVLKY